MDGFLLLLVVTHKPIPIFRLPKSSAAFDYFVCLNGGERFPILNDFGQRDLADFNQSMNVIGHDNPGQHLKTFAMVMCHGGLDESRDAWFAQKAFTEAAIQILFEFYSLFTQSDALRSGARSIAPRVDRQQMFPLAAS